MGFPRGSVIKNLPATQETRIQSLGREVPLEKEMATHSSTIPWRIPWTEEPDCSPWGRKESDTTESIHFIYQRKVSQILAKDYPDL